VLCYNCWAFVRVHRIVSRAEQDVQSLSMASRSTTDAGCDLALPLASSVEPSVKRASVQLWPTFTAYASVFVVSQGPGAVCNFLQSWFHVRSTRVENCACATSDELEKVCARIVLRLSQAVPPGTVVDQTTVALGYAHGILNALVYGASNKRLFEAWRQWPWCVSWLAGGCKCHRLWHSSSMATECEYMSM